MLRSNSLPTESVGKEWCSTFGSRITSPDDQVTLLISFVEGACALSLQRVSSRHSLPPQCGSQAHHCDSPLELGLDKKKSEHLADASYRVGDGRLHSQRSRT